MYDWEREEAQKWKDSVDKTKFKVPKDMNEEDTGQKYVDNAACFGVPCPKNLVQHKKYDEPPTRLGLPWEGHDTKEYDEIMDLHSRRYKDMATGKYKSG